MDRVQKSKLSLYKKAMEVGARLSGLEGGRRGVDPRQTWDGHLGQGWPQVFTQLHAHWPVP